MVQCAICREKAAVQEHHLSYYPEMKIDVCDSCHKLLHKHGVGYAKKSRTQSILEEVWAQEDRIITRDELKEICKRVDADYDDTIRHFLRRGWMIRILRGIFYVRTFEEKNTGKLSPNHLELVARALERKGGLEWYFGLHSALKLNNMTHEYFSTEEVFNNRIFRAKPITINGYPFRFRKVKSSLFRFGIIEDKKGVKYSDPEKTILDFMYIWRYSGIPEERIMLDVSEWARNLSGTRMREYAKHYPNAVERMVEKVLG